MQKTILFDDYSIQDLFREIVNNSRQVRSQIKETLSNLNSQIETLVDYQVLSPEISNYLNTLVKNDEILIKLAGVVAKIVSAKARMEDQNDNKQLSPEEKQLLIKQARQQLKPFFEIGRKKFNEN